MITAKILNPTFPKYWVGNKMLFKAVSSLEVMGLLNIGLLRAGKVTWPTQQNFT